MIFEPVWISGVFLWALALYLMFSPLALRLVGVLEHQVISWLESSNRQNLSGPAELTAAVMSIVPFVLTGGICNYLLDISLGQSWTLSFGIIACMGSGIYELGRRDGQANQD